VGEFAHTVNGANQCNRALQISAIARCKSVRLRAPNQCDCALETSPIAELATTFGSDSRVTQRISARATNALRDSLLLERRVVLRGFDERPTLSNNSA
jgi:hypothetical protein